MDTKADSGEDGTILLDSRDINIVADDGTINNNEEVLDESIFLADGFSEDFTITDTVLTGLTGNIILEAERNITAEDNANLFFPSQTFGDTITFTAGDNIEINANLATAGGNLNFTTTNGNIEINANLSTSRNSLNAGEISLTAGGDIRTQNVDAFAELGNPGNISFNSQGNIDTTAGTLRAGSNLENGGSIDLTAAGNINTGTITAVSENQNGGSITLNSTGRGD